MVINRRLEIQSNIESNIESNRSLEFQLHGEIHWLHNAESISRVGLEAAVFYIKIVGESID